MSKRIAVFEDDEDIRYLIELMVEQAGFVVTSFESGVDFEDNLGELGFDAVITDYNLGTGPDGYEIALHVTFNLEVPCLLHTGYPEEDWPEHFKSGALGENVTVSEKEIGLLEVEDFLSKLS
ncbi:response regulator [Candidatus Kaiserbacteria bacterium]|nr:response regulator [Candidatus Kaiserbacteria bacterium]